MAQRTSPPPAHTHHIPRVGPRLRLLLIRRHGRAGGGPLALLGGACDVDGTGGYVNLNVGYVPALVVCRSRLLGLAPILHVCGTRDGALGGRPCIALGTLAARGAGVRVPRLVGVHGRADGGARKGGVITRAR